MSDITFTLDFSVNANNEPTFAWSPSSISVAPGTPTTVAVTLTGPSSANFFGHVLWSDVSSGQPSIHQPHSISQVLMGEKLITFTSNYPHQQTWKVGFCVVIQYTPPGGDTYYYLSPDPVIINEPG